MNEQEQISQLSALYDGELPPQQTQMIVRRALKDPALRASWERYALIGACLRNEPIAVHPQGSLADRVRAQLAGEDELGGSTAAQHEPAEAAKGRGSFWAGRGVMGGAIAAGVALVAVVLVRSMVPGGQTEALVARQGPASISPVVAAVDAAPRSYTTPGENSPAMRRIEQPLAHYLVAHSEVAASTFGYSNDLTQGAVEMTEAEIRAHR
jgi:negative regulator of sigma E activity